MVTAVKRTEGSNLASSLPQLSPREVDQEQAPGHSSPCPLPEAQQVRREPPPLGMDYLSVPPALAWGRSRANAHSPLFRYSLTPVSPSRQVSGRTRKRALNNQQHLCDQV